MGDTAHAYIKNDFLTKLHPRLPIAGCLGVCARGFLFLLPAFLGLLAKRAQGSGRCFVIFNRDKREDSWRSCQERHGLCASDFFYTDGRIWKQSFHKLYPFCLLASLGLEPLGPPPSFDLSPSLSHRFAFLHQLLIDCAFQKGHTFAIQPTEQRVKEAFMSWHQSGRWVLFLRPLHLSSLQAGTRRLLLPQNPKWKYSHCLAYFFVSISALWEILRIISRYQVNPQPAFKPVEIAATPSEGLHRYRSVSVLWRFNIQ